jgi:ABC-2 type transport system ATP-binding protein
MRVRQYVVFMARLAGVSSRDAGDRADQTMVLVGLSGTEDRPIGRLSRGYRQRVAFAQAIVAGPSLLLLDEPTTGMDPVQIQDFHEVLRNLPTTAAIVLSSHNLHHVAEVCDRVAVLHEGCLVEVGSVSEVTNRLSGVADRAVIALRGDRARAMDIASQVDRQATVRELGDSLELYVHLDDERHLGDIVRRLAVAGLDVVGIRHEGASLEAAFLDHAGTRSQ